MNKFASSQKWAANFNRMVFSMDYLRKKAKGLGIVDVRVRTKEEDPLYPRIQITMKDDRILVWGIPAGDPESFRIYFAGWLAGFDEGRRMQ